MLLRGVQWTPTLIFSEVGHGKTKLNRWSKRSPKMRNLHRCHCMQKFSKYEKTRKTYRLGSNGPPPAPPPPPPSVSRGKYLKVEGKYFYSHVTKRRYKIKQNVNCQSKNLIYLVTCNK